MDMVEEARLGLNHSLLVMAWLRPGPQVVAVSLMMQ